MSYTRKDLKKILEENGNLIIDKTAENKMALMMLAIENNLISKDTVFGSKNRGVRPVGRHVGRPRIHEIKEKKPTDPKYERLGLIRNNPVSVRLTNVETGEIIIYTSLYKAMNGTGHGFRYLKARNGKVDEGFKIEIL